MIRILLVDDSPVDRRLFAELLSTESDFDVYSCEDGAIALQTMADDAPDIVVTDMQMPIMDGLALVKQVREKFSQIPVVLITGFGSESLATNALRAGAAGYVPKSHGRELLVDTIRHVLELNKTSQIDSRLNALTSLIHHELELPNDEELIPSVLQVARQHVSAYTECDSVTVLQLEVALEHAILNAMYHGNLEFNQHTAVGFDAETRRKEAKILNAKPPYCDRRVSVGIRVASDEVRFVVKDEGSGFDVKEVSSLGLTHSLRGEFGQGLFLMWAFADKVVFGKTGNSVTLIKRSQPSKLTEEKKDPKDQPATIEPVAEVLVCLRPTKGGRAFNITKERVTIGRDASCDIVIDSTSVSHHHCLLFVHEGWWFVRDLKSKNGIKINGKKFDQHLLTPTSILAVGSYEFAVEYQPHKLGAVGITPPVDPF